MNFLNLPWEIILIILKQYNDYKYCIRLLMTCKQLYQNKLLVKKIKDHFTEYEVDNDGNQYWCFNGKFHRENDKPAIIESSGNQYWYFNDKCHRDNDKPAIIWPNGDKRWYFNGREHREDDKPAYHNIDGYKAWYKNGERHRNNGKPAIIAPAFRNEYWINGYFIKIE